MSRQVETSEAGACRVFPLNPGTYDITASMRGFKTQAQPGVVLEIAAIVKVDFQLEVGEITETVEVSASATLLQTQEASVGGTVTGNEIARMPVNVRRPFTPIPQWIPGLPASGEEGSSWEP